MPSHRRGIGHVAPYFGTQARFKVVGKTRKKRPLLPCKRIVGSVFGRRKMAQHRRDAHPRKRPNGLGHRPPFVGTKATLQRDIQQARLDKAVENVRRTVIRAPHDGQVSDCNVLAGQIVIGAQSINSGTLLMTVSDTSVLRVDVNLNEFAATRVALGREATVTFDSIPNLRKKGEISFMTPFGTADTKVPDLRVFPTQVSFPAGDGVRPGISANVSVLVAREKQCVAVPVSAVFIEGPDRVLYVRDADGGWDRRVVTLGLSDASWTQVREGVAPGAVVSLVRPAAPAR